MGFETVSCLFCASPCSPSFAIIDGKLTRLKSEEPAANGNLTSSSLSSPLCFLENEGNSLLAQQLQVMFILRNILKLKDEKITQFLGRLDGQLNPEFWIQLCQTCGSTVKKYFETLKEVSRLQRKLTSISDGLKAQIEETREAHEDAEENDEEEDTFRAIWKEAREAVLLNTTELEVDPPSNLQNERNPGKILVDGDIRVEWDEEDGSLHLDVPDLSSLKQILGLGYDQEEFPHPKVTIQQKSSPPKVSPQHSGSCSSISNHSDSQNSPPPHISTNCKGRRRKIAHQKLPKPGGKSNTTVPKRFNVYYKCPDCGSLFTTQPLVMAHIKRHEKGEGTICSQCGWLTTKLGQHTKHEERKKAELQKRMESYTIREFGAKKKPRVLSSSPKKKAVKVVKASSDINWRRPLKCEHCPYFSKYQLYFDAHQELHQPDSEAVSCPTCGWFVVPSNLKRHVSLHHSKRSYQKPKPKRRNPRQRTVCKCADCGALFHNLLIVKQHQQLHEKGEGVSCPDCGWLTSNLKKHRTSWHPQEETQKAELRKRMESYRIRQFRSQKAEVEESI